MRRGIIGVAQRRHGGREATAQRRGDVRDGSARRDDGREERRRGEGCEDVHEVRMSPAERAGRPEHAGDDGGVVGESGACGGHDGVGDGRQQRYVIDAEHRARVQQVGELDGGERERPAPQALREGADEGRVAAAVTGEQVEQAVEVLGGGVSAQGEGSLLKGGVQAGARRTASRRIQHRHNVLHVVHL